MTVTPELIVDMDGFKVLIEHVANTNKRFFKVVKDFYSNVKEGEGTAIGQTLRQFKTYPPPVPYTRYKRTFRLRRSWRIVPQIQDSKGEIKADSDTPYANKVMGELQEPFFMSRGWIPSPEIAIGYHRANEEEIGLLWTSVTIIP